MTHTFEQLIDDVKKEAEAHTAGPWFPHDGTIPADNERGFIGTYCIINTCPRTVDTKAIADVFAYGGENFPTKDEALANTKLIAAAPDMLKAIQLALNIKDLWAPVNFPPEEHEGEMKALQAMLTTLEAAIDKATKYQL